MAKRGRPSSYKPEYADQAYKLCLLGADDAKLADFFGVSVATVSNWKTSQPDFLDALKAGKDDADANVGQSLYQRAMGYSHPEDKIFLPAGKDEPVIVPTIKHYPPDTTACIFWLKNRQKLNWRDRLEHTGEDGGPMKVEIVRYADDPPAE